MVTCSTIHIHTARIGQPLKKMLLAQDAASARSQKQEERPGVLQEEGEGCQEQDKKAKDRQDDVKLKAKDSTTPDSIDLNRSPSSLVWWGRRHL